jgi:altronate dehydratase small subunit
MKQCFLIHPDDNVATLTEDAGLESLLVVGGVMGATVQTTEPIPPGHKIALAAIEPEGAIVKYGVVIGLATRSIQRGGWVHLQNCRSMLDQRSGGLDLHTGAPRETAYE